MRTGTLTIGHVGAQAGVGRKAIRLYEANGLIPRPARAENGYRVYQPETVALLRFIKRAQSLDLKLAEIKEILEIQQQGGLPCRHVRTVLQQKVAAVDQRLADLGELRRELRAMLKDWSQRSQSGALVCPHIEEIPPRQRSSRNRRKAARA